MIYIMLVLKMQARKDKTHKDKFLVASHPYISRNADSRGSTYHHTREVILMFLERGDLGEPDLLVSQKKY